MANESIDQLINTLADNDLKLIIKAKSEAQKKVNENPSKENLAGLKYADKVLSDYLAANNLTQILDKAKPRFKNAKEIAVYIKKNNRKAGERKIKYDIKNGKIKRQADQTYLQEDIDEYMETLNYIATPGDLTREAKARQEAKEIADIRIKEAQAKTAEHKLAILESRFLPKADVYAEIAARIAVLRDGIKNNLEAQAIDVIKKVQGGITGEQLAYELCNIIDFSLSDFAKPLDLTVDFSQMEDMVEQDGE